MSNKMMKIIAGSQLLFAVQFILMAWAINGYEDLEVGDVFRDLFMLGVMSIFIIAMSIVIVSGILSLTRQNNKKPVKKEAEKK